MAAPLDTGPQPINAPTRSSDAKWLDVLRREHDEELPRLQTLLNYYNGEQKLSYMHPEVQGLIGDRVRQLVVNWPRLVVDSLEERIDLEGFRFPEATDRSDELNRIFQYNRMDTAYQQAHTTALGLKRAFAVVGTNPRSGDQQYPLITVESPLQMHVRLDPGTRQVVGALKRWQDEPVDADGESMLRYATLYRPNHTVTFLGIGGGWMEVSRDEHNLGRVPVVPIINRAQLWEPMGTSELDDVIPISDALCKIATDMMISAEFHAMPRRWALGFDDDDFKDREGKWMSAWKTIAGVLWSTPKTYADDGAQLGQFNESDLRNFHDTMRALAVQVGAVTGLPMHTLGYSSDNPASAAGINSASDRHIKRAERRITGFEQAWEDVARLALHVRDGKPNEQARWLETEWADAATPTFAAKADAIVKLYQADKLVPRRSARRTLGYTPGQIKDMERQDEQDVTRMLTEPDMMAGPKPDRGGGDVSDRTDGDGRTPPKQPVSGTRSNGES